MPQVKINVRQYLHGMASMARLVSFEDELPRLEMSLSSSADTLLLELGSSTDANTNRTVNSIVDFAEDVKKFSNAYKVVDEEVVRSFSDGWNEAAQKVVDMCAKVSHKSKDYASQAEMLAQATKKYILRDGEVELTTPVYNILASAYELFTQITSTLRDVENNLSQVTS